MIDLMENKKLAHAAKKELQEIYPRFVFDSVVIFMFSGIPWPFLRAT